MTYGIDYLRLSKEDGKEGESGSITNQRKIIQEYCSTHGIVLVAEFVDDDYSGGNFNRPGFQQMLSYLKKNNNVDVVITKDLSRLGRDMSESSYYAERYFPEHGVRYLAINDSFDSEADNMLAPFQFAMNDMYIRDVSKKVKNSLHIMMDRGEYCFMAPYGYKKDRRDNHHLVPDPETAPVVASIFEMAKNGLSAQKIAATLTANGVRPPLRYRVDELEGERSGNKKYASDEWSHMTVRRILQNQVYLGNTLLGKTKKVSPKSDKKRRVPKTEWRVTEHTHEAIVDKRTYDIAGANLGARSRDYRQYQQVRKSIFSGIAYCATCGAAMCSSGTVYNGEREKYWYLTCQNIPSRSKHRCANGARIRYSTLVDIVAADIRSVIALSPEKKAEIVETVSGALQDTSEQRNLEKRAAFIRARIHTIDTTVSGLYEDMYTGLVPRERAASMIQKYEEELSALSAELNTIMSTLSVRRDTKEDYERFFSIVGQVTEFSELNRDILLDFVDRIEIGPVCYVDGKPHGSRSKVPFEQDIRIYYKFIGEAAFS